MLSFINLVFCINLFCLVPTNTNVLHSWPFKALRQLHTRCSYNFYWLIPFSCRHKWMRGHQWQGSFVSQRAVHQHWGILQMHLFCGFCGFSKAAHVHPNNPRSKDEGLWKLRERLLLEDPPPTPFGTKPATAPLKRPRIYIFFNIIHTTALYSHSRSLGGVQWMYYIALSTH